MIKTIKNNISTRKGFIIGVITLLLFNFAFIGIYYTIHLNKEINTHYNIVRDTLDKEIENISNLIKNDQEVDEKLEKYAKEKRITIEISNKNNEPIETYKAPKTNKPGTKIIVSRIIDYKDTEYLLTISQKQDIIGISIIIDFFAFELLIIGILGSTGILSANKKILEPLTKLSKDFSNYKLGILPKKRKVKDII